MHNYKLLINELFKTIVDKRQMFFLHDNKGKIIKVLTAPEFNPMKMYDTIIEKKDLSDFFDIKPLHRAHKPGEIIELRGRNIREYSFPFGTLLSSTSLHNIKTVFAGDNTFIGRITINEIMPPIHLSDGLGTLFSNIETETLIAFDKSIAPLLSPNSRNFETLLGKPLSDFLSPTPREFQHRFLQKIDAESYKSFALSYSHDASDLLNNSIRISHESERKHIDDGLQITASVNRSAIVRFLQTARDNCDFAFSVTFIHNNGIGPCIAIGSPSTDSEEPDHDGYLAGYAIQGGYLVMKRNGYHVVRSKLEKNAEGSSETLTFVRIGNSFHLFHNDKHHLSYYDIDPQNWTEASFAVVLRSASAITIKNAELRVNKRTSSVSENRSTPYIVELKAHPGRFCIMSRFDSNPISSLWSNFMAGWQPIDITTFESTIKQLETKSRRLTRKNMVLDTLLKNFRNDSSEKLMGSSDKFSKLRSTADTIAPTDSTVLIEGETGVGKEVLAQYIHSKSKRSSNSFVKIDCSTIPTTLIESHLFGHEKGAFSGAIERSIGLLEQSDNGTIFLDEIGNIPLEVQAKLLRFFNDYTITRLGGNTPIKVNTRPIVATNANLADMVKAGKFRSDLYYRISVIKIAVPALRERKEDIAELANFFMLKCAALNNKQISEISTEAMDLLRNYNWPGNVRELKNVIERAVVFSSDNILTPSLINFEEQNNSLKSKRYKPRINFSLSKTEPAKIITLLERHNGNISAAAREIGTNRIGLHLYLKKHNINPDAHRKGL
ncbi:MAG: sigma-54-dependent Fis family transcriptional regulator [Fibrobacteres bacterium]|nr:sigma-54-dependent Fis family transcriptional regulator [Fibrobacterota bacterium]